MKESKAMMKKEVSFMKKKGAPKSMLKHEMKEAGMKGMEAGGISKKLPTSKQMGSMTLKAGGAVGYKAGGAAKRADGVAKKGHTKGKLMRSGGMCK
jgi:hypothetical protein